MIAVCQDCSSPRKALIKCLPEHCWGAYIIVSKISAHHHFWWIPHSSSLWEWESISSTFISLDIGNNFGPWNIPRRTPAISKRRIFASFLLLQWNIWLRELFEERAYFCVQFLRFQFRIRWPIVVVLWKTQQTQSSECAVEQTYSPHEPKSKRRQRPRFNNVL